MRGILRMILTRRQRYKVIPMSPYFGESMMLDNLEVKIISSFVGGYTMTNYYLCKAMYQMMAYDLCLKGEQS